MSYIPFTASQLTIGPHSLRLPYNEAGYDSRTTIHWEDRKLLLSEIEFLTVYCQNDATVVYIGAAPGIHLPILSRLFPQVVFHLYDPEPFDFESTDRLQIFNQLFTDETAAAYGQQSNIFLICNLRTDDYSKIKSDVLKEFGITTFNVRGEPIGKKHILRAVDKETLKRREARLWEDMETQQRWLQMINPQESLLKFRLPYVLDNQDNLQYLKGIVFWLVWGPQKSTETRLKPVRNAAGEYEIGSWDPLEYEQWGFYHNSVDREKHQYLNPLTQQAEPVDPPQLLNDYDSVAEAYILQRYFKNIGVTDPTKVIQLSGAITWILNKKKSGQTISDRRIKVNRSNARPALDPYRSKGKRTTKVNPSIIRTRRQSIQTNRHMTTRRQSPTTKQTRGPSPRKVPSPPKRVSSPSTTTNRKVPPRTDRKVLPTTTGRKVPSTTARKVPPPPKRVPSPSTTTARKVPSPGTSTTRRVPPPTTTGRKVPSPPKRVSSPSTTTARKVPPTTRRIPSTRRVAVPPRPSHR